MAATQPQSLDHITEDKPSKPDVMKDRDAGTIGHRRNNSGYPPNVFVPQAPTFYYRGYENAVLEWGEYPPYVNAESVEIESPGIYNDNLSLMYHPGYGYSSQMPYGPFSPAPTPLSSVGGDAHLYPPQQFSFSGPAFYSHPGPPGLPYMASPTPMSQPDPNHIASIDQHGDSMIVGPRPNYPTPVGSFGRGGSLGPVSPHDMLQGFDGLRCGGLWSEWPQHSDNHGQLTPFSPAVSPQPFGTFRLFGPNSGPASQPQRTSYGSGSSTNSYSRGYLPPGVNQGSSFRSPAVASLGSHNRGWISLENMKPRGIDNISLCGCDGTDIFSEQNRGPRASKPRSQAATEHSSTDNGNHSKPTCKVYDESYNHPDFLTEYNDAKFFVIKSYSEDNVHKSIKYGVWASTPSGNKKLDAGYRDAKEKQEPCPTFLFFSVNASGQFCGVAEMVGAVDFDKNVDYWQQDKWSGHFPVKWHIIKDVPNGQFRHILLENNDNKPVTNSRDTQEVRLDQGNEMLKIFKHYDTDMSILEDFDFYEDRQRVMQERKAKQQAALRAAGILADSEPKSDVTLPNDLIKHMSKSFAQVVRMDESRKEGNAPELAGSGSDPPLVAVIGLDDASKMISSS